jgi:hypothetical protein
MIIMSSLRISRSHSRLLWLLAVGLIVATALHRVIVSTALGRLRRQLQGGEEFLSALDLDLDLDWRSINADANAENKTDAAADGTDMERWVPQRNESPSAYKNLPILKA